jgi:hypothetical protein
MTAAPLSPQPEELFVHGATVGSLVRFLDPTVPWVWILGHWPNPRVEWWEVDVALDTCGSRLKALVRHLEYDLQLSTAEFLTVASAFEHCGIDLVQSHRKMPDTLDWRRIPDGHQSQVLRLNGAFLYIHLPHAVETALVHCFEAGYLERFAATDGNG